MRAMPAAGGGRLAIRMPAVTEEPLRRVVGTAGHIDHGKSSLVRALTGTDPDRLPEEKRRGITVDLGFANLVEEDVQIGFVDVPGHERFVRNMLAGAGGVDVVLLVVAADESVMPQTHEHFDICRLLGVREGIIAITKADLVEPEMIDLVRMEVADLVRGSFLERAPVLPVSSNSGQGLDDLRRTLIETVRRAGTRETAMHSRRLPVDRVFTVRGFGTVITGTLVAGRIERDDDVQLFPSGRMSRARGIEVHGQTKDAASAGERTSVNLADVALDQIARGHQIVEPHAFRESRVFIAELVLLESSPQLKDGARVHLHVHSSETVGTVRLFGGARALAPGDEAIVRITTSEPLVLVADDRFVIRRYSPLQTIGGGRVLDPSPGRIRISSSPEAYRPLAGADPSERVRWWVRRAGVKGTTIADLRQKTGWSLAFTRTSLDGVDGLIPVREGGPWLHQEAVTTVRRRAMDLLEAWFRDQKMTLGMPKQTFLQKLLPRGTDAGVVNWILGDLEREKIAAVQGDLVTVPGRRRELAGAEGELANRVEARFREAGLQPPNLGEIVRSVAQKSKIVEGIIGFLTRTGVLIRLADGLWLHREVVEQARAKLQEHRGSVVDVAWFKDLFGLSRKIAIPLLEHFDATSVTRRVGDRREIL